MIFENEQTSFVTLNGSISSKLDSKDPFAANCDLPWRKISDIPRVIELESVKLNGYSIVPSRIAHCFFVTKWFGFRSNLGKICLKLWRQSMKRYKVC